MARTSSVGLEVRVSKDDVSLCLRYRSNPVHRYYVLVAACVFGRGSEWLRSACLAAALLLPAVAALHGIVLAAIHVDG